MLKHIIRKAQHLSKEAITRENKEIQEINTALQKDSEETRQKIVLYLASSFSEAQLRIKIENIKALLNLKEKHPAIFKKIIEAINEENSHRQDPAFAYALEIKNKIISLFSDFRKSEGLAKRIKKNRIINLIKYYLYLAETAFEFGLYDSIKHCPTLLIHLHNSAPFDENIIRDLVYEFQLFANKIANSNSPLLKEISRRINETIRKIKEKDNFPFY